MRPENLITCPQLEVFPDRLRLRRVEPEQNMDRYYFMAVQRDLFGGACLVREWGRAGSSGQVRVTHHRDEGEAIDHLAAIVRQKRKRGYRPSI